MPSRPLISVFAIVALLVGAAQPPASAVGNPVAARPEPGPVPNGPVYAAVYAGDVLYLGGDFTSVTSGGRAQARSRLAAVDARSGDLLPWVPTADGRVLALAVAGSTVYVGGGFGQVGGANRTGLASVDSGTGEVTAFDPRPRGQVLALAAGPDRLYVGGRLGSTGNVAAYTLATGERDAGWRARTDGVVETLAVAGSRVYLGGNFTALNSVTGTGRLAAVDAVTGARVPEFTPRIDARVWDLATGGDGSVYAAVAGPGGRTFALDGTGATRWIATTDGDPQAVTHLDGVVYTGGHFDRACTTPRVGDKGVCLDGSASRIKLAALDAGTGQLLAWDPRGNGVHGVFALAAHPGLGKVTAGGEFTTVGGVRWPYLARFGR